MKDFYPKLLIKIFYDKYIKNTTINNQHENFKVLLNYLGVKVPKKINYYNEYKFKFNKFKLKRPYIHLHLDEKWFENNYYNDFDYMKLNSNKIYTFISDLVKIYKKNILVTQGHIKINEMDKFKFKYLDLKKNLNILKVNNRHIYFYDNTDFRDLENLVKNSSLLICCEGALSHVSHAMKIKTIALIQKNRPDISKFWTSHMSKIKLVNRTSIKVLSKKLKQFSYDF